MRKLGWIAFFLAVAAPLIAHQRIYFGPEVYHIQRTRASGSRMNGTMHGGRVGYERRKMCALYWGIEYWFANGGLKGHSARGYSLAANMRTGQAEGYAGWRFRLGRLSVTPFVGGGHLREVTNFDITSPLPVRFCTTFGYSLAGVRTELFLFRRFTLGIDFKIRFLADFALGFGSESGYTVSVGHNYVSGDPDHKPVDQIIDRGNEYVIEVPLTYYTCKRNVAFAFVPFGRIRRYGFRENYPFDFIQTRFYMSGARFQFMFIY